LEDQKSSGKRQVTISTCVNPVVDDKKAVNKYSTHVLPEHSLPREFSLLLRSDSATQPVTVADLRLAHYMRDVLP